MGRPRKDVDGDQVLKLARLGCTNGEIGDFFGVSDETIRIRFVDELSLGRADQKISLRRWQAKSAHAGSVPMLIHLGKQYLGQSDKAEVEQKTSLTLDGQMPKDIDAAITAFGYTRIIPEAVGEHEPGPLCGAGERGPMEDSPPPGSAE